MILYIKEKENQILELKNQNKNSKQKYSNEISILKEKNKKLEEDIKKLNIDNEKLIQKQKITEDLNTNLNLQIKSERNKNSQNEQIIQTLKNNNNESKKKYDDIVAYYKKNINNLNKINSEEKQKLNNIIKEKNEMNNMIDKYKEQIQENVKKFKDFEEKVKSVFQENKKKYANLENKNKNLENQLNEQNIIMSKKDEKIIQLNLKISQLNQSKLNNKEQEEKKMKEIEEKNNEINDKFEKEIEIIKKKYEKDIEEKYKTIKISMIKNIGNKLSELKKKYIDLYQKKFGQIENLIKKSNNDLGIINNMNISGIQNIPVENSDLSINLDNDNNFLSKTYIFSKKNPINIDKIDEQNINAPNIKNNNNNKHYLNNIAPQEPQNKINKKENKNMINDVMKTPGGEKEEEYSFDCTNAMYLTQYIYEGTEEVRIDILIKNNGNKTWPKNSKFKIEESSIFKIDDIILRQQRPGEEGKYTAIFQNLKNIPHGEYLANFLFCVNGEVFGEKLVIKINIKDNNINSELENNRDKINEFRDTFSFDKIEYPDDVLLGILKDNDFNMEAAFSSMFGS